MTGSACSPSESLAMGEGTSVGCVGMRKTGVPVGGRLASSSRAVSGLPRVGMKIASKSRLDCALTVAERSVGEATLLRPNSDRGLTSSVNGTSATLTVAHAPAGASSRIVPCTGRLQISRKPAFPPAPAFGPVSLASLACRQFRHTCIPTLLVRTAEGERVRRRRG